MSEVVAPRNDPKKLSLRSQSETYLLQGRNKDYHYERKSLDPAHPQYVGKYLRPHEIGGPDSGYITVGPWEVVEAKDSNHKALAKSAADGKDIDTTVQRGGLILVRIHKDEYAKYALVDKARDEYRSRYLAADSSSKGGVKTRMGMRIGNAEDGAANASVQDVITGA